MSESISIESKGTKLFYERYALLIFVGVFLIVFWIALGVAYPLSVYLKISWLSWLTATAVFGASTGAIIFAGLVALTLFVLLLTLTYLAYKSTYLGNLAKGVICTLLVFITLTVLTSIGFAIAGFLLGATATSGILGILTTLPAAIATLAALAIKAFAEFAVISALAAGILSGAGIVAVLALISVAIFIIFYYRLSNEAKPERIQDTAGKAATNKLKGVKKLTKNEEVHDFNKERQRKPLNYQYGKRYDALFTDKCPNLEIKKSIEDFIAKAMGEENIASYTEEKLIKHLKKTLYKTSYLVSDYFSGKRQKLSLNKALCNFLIQKTVERINKIKLSKEKYSALYEEKNEENNPVKDKIDGFIDYTAQNLFNSHGAYFSTTDKEEVKKKIQESLHSYIELYDKAGIINAYCSGGKGNLLQGEIEVAYYGLIISVTNPIVEKYNNLVKSYKKKLADEKKKEVDDLVGKINDEYNVDKERFGLKAAPLNPHLHPLDKKEISIIGQLFDKIAKPFKEHFDIYSKQYLINIINLLADADADGREAIVDSFTSLQLIDAKKNYIIENSKNGVWLSVYEILLQLEGIKNKEKRQKIVKLTLNIATQVRNDKLPVMKMSDVAFIIGNLARGGG